MARNNNESLKLELFRSGMYHAANLKLRLSANEADGADRFKQEIRARANRLKKLPKFIPS